MAMSRSELPSAEREVSWPMSAWGQALTDGPRRQPQVSGATLAAAGAVAAVAVAGVLGVL